MYIYMCVYTHANLNGKPVLDTNITIHSRLSITHILTPMFSHLIYNLSQLEGIVVVAVITSSPSTPKLIRTMPCLLPSILYCRVLILSGIESQ